MKNNLAKNRLQYEQNYFDEIVTEGKSVQTHYSFGTMDLVFNRFVELLGNISDREVLEVGCGTGWLTRILLRKRPKLFTFDISFESAKMTKEKLANKKNRNTKNNLLICKMNAESLGIKQETIDVVVCWAIIHHTDIEATSNEIHRVLKNNGRAIVVEPLGHNMLLNIYRHLTPKKRTVDEKPLKSDDLETFKKKFRSFSQEEFYLLSLMAFFWYFVFRSKKLFLKTQKILHTLDLRILKLLPFLKRYCWYSIFILKK